MTLPATNNTIFTTPPDQGSVNLSINGSIAADSISINSSINLDGYTITTSSAYGSTVLLFNGKPITTQSSRISIGTDAGTTNQGNYAVAMGYLAARDNQGNGAVAIGDQSGKNKQGNYAVAIGYLAGESAQGQVSVAIGDQAGKISQGGYAVAVGAYAGQYNQANNSIVINATGNSLAGNISSAFYVKPVRSVTGATSKGFVAVFYNPATGEFVYGTP